MDNEALKSTFQDAGEAFGIKSVEAEFQPFRDLKIRWTRTYDMIDFMVTDYLKQAPEEVIEDLARVLFSKIYGDSETDYTETFNDWVTSDEFVKLNRDTFLQRSNALSEDFKSRFHSLQETYEDLISKGMIKKIPGLSLRWTDNRKVEPLGVSSVLMRSVVIPTYMDSSNVPDDVFEFNLFRLLTNIELDFTVKPEERKKLADAKIASYPDSVRLMDLIEDRRNLAVCGVI